MGIWPKGRKMGRSLIRGKCGRKQKTDKKGATTKEHIEEQKRRDPTLGSAWRLEPTLLWNLPKQVEINSIGR